MSIDFKYRYNVAFNGGVADVNIIPTPQMIELELQAINLRAEAQRIMNQVFEIGQNQATVEFCLKHPKLV